MFKVLLSHSAKEAPKLDCECITYADALGKLLAAAQAAYGADEYVDFWGGVKGPTGGICAVIQMGNRLPIPEPRSRKAARR